MRTISTRTIGLLLTVGIIQVGVACGDNTTGNQLGIANECNPLGGTHCMMPWPSSVYLDTDETSASGFSLAIPPAAMAVNIDGIAIDPTAWNRHDGFSAVGAIVVAFPGGVSAAGLPTSDDPSASQDADSPVLLIDMESGERPLLFAEVDQGIDDETKRVLFIRPLERLKPKTRYAVAIRDSVLAADGSALERPAGFAALAEDKVVSHPRYAKVAPGYPAIFEAIEAHGVDRAELVLAWDFVTASDESLTRDMLTMRDAAVPAIGEAGANLTFDVTEVANTRANVHKLYVGTHTAPNFLTDGESDNSIIIRDDADLPKLEGMYEANFAVVVPECVNTAPLPIPAVLFGHGLFGSGESYIEDNFLQRVANEKCFVIFAGDLIGLSERQITIAALSSNDLNRSHALSEKLGQAVINFISLGNLMRGPMAESELFELGGEPIIDPERIWYLGGSLGGIMGGTLMAYDQDLELGALGVPGSNWSLLFERSFAWTPLQIAARSAYENPYDYQMLVSLLAFSLERWDPITTARRVIDDPLPNTPAKQILVYETLNDSLVTNLATEMLARTMNLPVVGPTVRTPPGFMVTSDAVPNGFTIYDENVPVATEVNVPPASDNGTHSDVNEREAVLDQVDNFFRQREVVNMCGDDEPVVCDCGTGACD